MARQHVAALCGAQHTQQIRAHESTDCTQSLHTALPQNCALSQNGKTRHPARCSAAFHFGCWNDVKPSAFCGFWSSKICRARAATCGAQHAGRAQQHAEHGTELRTALCACPRKPHGAHLVVHLRRAWVLVNVRGLDVLVPCGLAGQAPAQRACASTHVACATMQAAAGARRCTAPWRLVTSQWQQGGGRHMHGLCPALTRKCPSRRPGGA